MLSGVFSRDIERLKRVFRSDADADIQFREFSLADRRACIIFVDGLVNTEWLQDFVIRPCMQAEPYGGSEDMLDYALRKLVRIACAKAADDLSEAVYDVFSGMTLLFCDGCRSAVIMDARKYPCRSVEHPHSESAVQGPQEGFTEHLRGNIAMIRRYVKTPDLITEMIDIGTRYPSQFAVMHLEGVARPHVVKAVMDRLHSIKAERVSGLGKLQQVIEDRPYALLPQMMLTERPDRAASALASGQVAILAENSPYALLAPVTLFQQITTMDDLFERWQYGSVQRVVRVIAMLMSVYLPGMYIAITQYHAHLMPMELLSSIAEARANVSFSLLAEVLIMEFSFSLINEAGIRIPGQIGSALGIVGALILGQAAVEASIISPIIIIIVAITGLGNYAIPDYGFSKGVELYRLIVLTGAAILGLPGIAVTSVAIAAHLSGMQSFGIPYLAPVAPERRPSPRMLVRWPPIRRRIGSFFTQIR